MGFSGGSVATKKVNPSQQVQGLRGLSGTSFDLIDPVADAADLLFWDGNASCALPFSAGANPAPFQR